MSIDPFDKHLDPPDWDENPRCMGCDEQMEQVDRRNVLVCTNPDCKLCDPRYKDQEGDDGICVNCEEVISFIHGAWTHTDEDGDPCTGGCKGAEPKRSKR